MAKDKSKGGGKNKHLHARIAFLHQAASYLTQDQDANQKVQQEEADKPKDKHEPTKPGPEEAPEQGLSSPLPQYRKNEISIKNPANGGLPLHLTTHLTQIARKSQIRLQPAMKHAVCKRCGTFQIEGITCTKYTENASKGQRKRHADVLVQECGVCGAGKRWPVGAVRQRKKSARLGEKARAATEGPSGAGEPPGDVVEGEG